MAPIAFVNSPIAIKGPVRWVGRDVTEGRMITKRWLTWFGLVLTTLVLVLVSACRLPLSSESPPVPEPSAPTPATPATPAPIQAPQVQAADLMAHVEALGYDRYFEGDRKRARVYMTQQLEAAGWSVSEQTFATGINVVAQRPDADPQAGNLLVVAHYDSINGSPGADDNASGVAGALEIARLLGDYPAKRNLQIVLFDQEEAGLVGSKAYVDQPDNIHNIEGVINLEMLGYACYTEGCQKKPPGLPVTPPSKLGDFAAVIGDTEHQPLLDAFDQTHQADLPILMTLPIPFKGALTPITLLSDHTSFWYKNIGAVMISDTAFLRNPHYHRKSDTPDTLDPEFFRGTTQIALNATAALLSSSDSLETPAPSKQS